MEELNKSQLILLALLVSFITSIATGIVTVTLMDQAPPAVTQTVNRVVRHTVETVVPGETETIVKEVPIIITEEELVVKAVNLATPLIYQIVKINEEGDEKQEPVGSAVLINKEKGRLVTSSAVKEEAGFTYAILGEDEKRFSVKIVSQAESSGKLAIVEVTSSEQTEFNSATSENDLLAYDTGEVSIGQTVIGLGSSDALNHVVAVGIVSSLNGNENQAVIRSNVATAELAGGAMLNIKGELVGIITGPGEVAPQAQVTSLIDSIN